MKWTLCGGPETLRRKWPQMVKCMCTISICSSQCNYSKKQQFYRLASFAQNTDVHTSGKKNGETPRLTKIGKTITCFMDNCVPLVVPGLSSSSSSSSASTSRPKDQSKSSSESEASTDPMTTRMPSMHAGNQCRETLTSKPRKAVVQHTQKNARHSCAS